jgi:hypothetical protein
LILLLALVAARSAGAASSVLVATGQASPLGRPFSGFSDPAIDDRGRIAFLGTSVALFRRSAGRITHLLAAGDGAAGRVVAGLGPPALGTDGCAALRVWFAGGGEGIYARCDSGLQEIARAGDAAPEGSVYAVFGNQVAAGGAGQVVFTARLADGATGLFIASGGTVAQVARTGMPSPAGGHFTGLRIVGAAADGRVAFRAAVTQGRDGLFVWDGQRLRSLVVVGDVSPEGGQFTAVGFGSLNALGDCVFRATVSAGEGRSGLFRTNVGLAVPRVDTVVLEGQSTPISGRFRPFSNSLVPVINSSGSIAFRATVTDALFGSGVFVVSPAGTLRKIVAAGEPTSVGQLVQLRDPELAEDGSVLLGASLAGGGSGLFVARGSALGVLARLGDATDLGGGFRFTLGRVRDTADGAAFLGQREGVFVARPGSVVEPLAIVGSPTPFGGVYAGFNPPAAGPGGRVVFRADLLNGRSTEALFTAGGLGARRFAAAGQRAPGGGAYLGFFAGAIDGLDRADVGPGGIAFQSTLAPAGSATGLFVRAGRNVRQVARSGKRAPGGGRFRAFGTPAVARGTRVAFVAGLSDTGTDSALFLRRGGRLRRVARGGDATGTRVGGRFVEFDAPDADGRLVVFRAELDTRGSEALFAGDGRKLGVLVASGDAGPGGETLSAVRAPAFVGRHVAFLGEHAGSGGTTALYAVRADAVPADDAPLPVVALARPGDPAPSGGTYLSLGAPHGNADGALAFTATLVEGPAASVVVRVEGATLP